MLEESISCSPGNNGKKSRSRRSFHKVAKKKCEQQYNITPTMATDNNTLPKEQFSSLESLYEDSTTHPGTSLNATTTHFEYFNPFENEKLLAAADRAEASSTSRNKMQNLTSKGFVRLDESLTSIREENKIFPMKPPSERPPRCHPAPSTPRSPHAHVLGPETQFGITESEFVRFCDDAESDVLLISDTNNSQTIPDDESKVETKQIINSKSIVEEILADFCGSPTESEIDEQTPPNSPPDKNLKGTKSIVDEILEDFCGSPFNGNYPKVNSDDSTPIFRFKSQPIRTYSRLRKKKLVPRNIATDMKAFTLKDDGNTSDSSSGLSVQEDFSQSVEPQLDTVDLNNSVKLCENLLNLSSYFSQLTSTSSSIKETAPPTSVVVIDETKDQRLSEIIDEIIKLKLKSLPINWNRIEDKCLGFSDFEENDSKESTLQELLDEDEDDVLQQINCDSLCYEKIVPKVSFFTHIDVDCDIEDTLQNASAVIEKAKALLLSETDDVDQKANNLKYKYQPDCDIHKDIDNKPLINSPLKDEQLFDDIDIWNDNECLLNYKTQKPLPKRFEHEHEDNDDKFNRSKQINEDKDSERKNSIMEKSKSVNKDRQQFQNQRDPCSSVSLNLPKTLRNNKIFKTNEGNSNEYKKSEKIVQLSAIIDTYPDTSTSFSNKNHPANENISDSNFINKSITSNFVGFSTVSKKPILISDIARQKANEFLKQFEQQESDKKMTLDQNELSKKDIKPVSSSKNKENETIKTNDKDNREQMIDEISFKEDKVQKAQCDISGPPKNTNFNNNFSVGFSTASKKLISISNKAKQKADDILKKFEQEEQEKRMLDTTLVTAGKSTISNYKKEKTVEDHSTPCGFVGFSTASEKPIAISLDAKRKADEILKKFEQAEKSEEEKIDMPTEKLTQRHPDEISEEVRRKAQELLLDIEFFEEAFEDELKKIEEVPMSQVQNVKRRATESTPVCSSTKEFPQATNENIFGGFKTASRKSIRISEEASRRAETFFKEVCDEDLPQEFLKCIETDINDTRKIPVDNLVDKVEQVDGAIKSPRHHLQDVEHMHANNGLEIQNRCSAHVSKDNIINHRTYNPVFEGLLEQREDSFKDMPLNTPKNNRIEKKRYLKRKHSEGNELEKSNSDGVTPRRSSCGERTPLNRIENGLLCKSSSLPLKECTPNSTLISRKNLLSLSKRRKIDSLGQIIESKSGPKTPEKDKKQLPSNVITHCNANSSSTPNLKEFFESVSTSTPRLIRNDDPTNKNNHNTSNYTIDSDFRPIQWEDTNNSFRINRTGCADDVSVTFSQVSPSPIQRIERLKMYGEPPPISPILMMNKCRTSGLRRGRSLMKP